MDLPDELGQIRERFPVDRLLVDGDPLAEPPGLLDRSRILAVMKDGEMQKSAFA